ncbi:RNA polymerase factor sigma-54 [uncultured Salinisphaera sp.]|uniref:RNA polymerase factor sigma-54 n=1 Tax=uncultured Salinisphaera sp. TaxID=359372 RepID=UPI0032B30ADD|tara:strand:+ start:301 stop:1743 length:1443 start_codon:yes stop_codon:yes gene_type:complete
MSMKQALGLNLGQTLTMTPALQQAIRMLQLSTLDLKTEIQEALDTNVMLEADDGTDDVEAADEPRAQTTAEADIPDNLPVDADWSDIYAAPAAAPSAPAGDDEDYWAYRQANLTSAPSLADHLIWQADMAGLSIAERAAAEILIDAVSADGLLHDWDELVPVVTKQTGLTPTAIDTVLDTVQGFDPPGVAARSLCECLMLQWAGLDTNTPGHALAGRLITPETLTMLAETDAARAAQRLDIDAPALAEALAVIRCLSPSPGDAFAALDVAYVVPEVFVTRSSAGWQVALNPDIAPRLRINSYYQSLIKRADKSADQSTLKSHLQEARFFLNSLKSRNDTLLEVAHTIVEAQRGFLEYGEEAMKPLVLRDVAERLDIHESTVSRATANKYMQTPRGVYELKYFFSSHVSTTDGGSASATAIQAMIKRLIAAEPADKPLSDSKLADQLLEAGIKVARRTVAKYREALGIAPTHERRKKRSNC